jgi:hypothetical protein
MWVDKESTVIHQRLVKENDEPSAEFKFGSATKHLRTMYKPMFQLVLDDGITLVFIDCHVIAIYNLEAVLEEFQ